MASRDYIILGGGCFWGVEELFSEQRGVVDTEVGYCGGELLNPSYKDICTGKTGHAETLKITFDTSQTSLDEIFEFFFRIHDPTQHNRQGNDIGSQYRSVIFYKSDEQKKLAQAAIEKAASRWQKPIVTSLEEESTFYSAEEYHQDYLKKNPGGYSCHYIRD